MKDLNELGVSRFKVLFSDNIKITMKNLNTKYIIVGAGIAGLQAANNLA